MSSHFSDILTLRPEPLIVNTRGKEDAADIRNWMRQNERDLAATLSALEHVPAVCDEIGRAMSRPKACPIISRAEFRNICAAVMQDDTSRWLLKQRGYAEAVCAYLHHSGEIIYDKDLNFIVRNPKWFGHGVLGHLIDLFSPSPHARRSHSIFRAASKAKNVVSKKEYHPRNGFMSKKSLIALLQVASRSVPGLDSQCEPLLTDDLIKLMLRFHLCCEQRPGALDTGYFIPATFDDEGLAATNGMRCWEWRTALNVDTDSFVGKRLECADRRRTFLTDGFFPRVQVSSKDTITYL